jgi:hypothetical protein
LANKLPDVIQVGLLQYTVSETYEDLAEYHNATGDDVYGVTDHVKGTILMAPHMNKSRKPITLMHEVLHAASEASGLHSMHDCDEEEQMVHLLAPVMVQVLRDNPKFVRYVIQGE